MPAGEERERERRRETAYRKSSSTLSTPPSMRAESRISGIRPKVSDRIPMLSRLWRSSVKKQRGRHDGRCRGQHERAAATLARARGQSARKSSGATENMLRSSMRSEKREA